MTSIDSTPIQHVEQKSTQKKEPQSKQEPQQKQNRKREKVKRPPKEPLDDPMKILEVVLAKSSFKEPNLSQIVEEKFYQAPDYKATVHKLLKNVKYESTVGLINGSSTDIETSVLPHGFSGRLELPVMAITELSCINSEIKKRKWPRGHKRKNNNNNQSQNNKNKSNAGNGNQIKKDGSQVEPTVINLVDKKGGLEVGADNKASAENQETKR